MAGTISGLLASFLIFLLLQDYVKLNEQKQKEKESSTKLGKKNTLKILEKEGILFCIFKRLLFLSNLLKSKYTHANSPFPLPYPMFSPSIPMSPQPL